MTVNNGYIMGANGFFPPGKLTVCYGIYGPFMEDLPIQDGDFAQQTVKLPEGHHQFMRYGYWTW